MLDPEEEDGGLNEEEVVVDEGVCHGGGERILPRKRQANLVLHYYAVSWIVHILLQGFTLVGFMPTQLPVNDYLHFTGQVIRLHFKPHSL